MTSLSQLPGKAVSRSTNAERNAQIVQLRKAGRTYGQIAAKLGVTRGVVAGAVTRAGLGADSSKAHYGSRPLAGGYAGGGSRKPDDASNSNPLALRGFSWEASQ